MLLGFVEDTSERQYRDAGSERAVNFDKSPLRLLLRVTCQHMFRNKKGVMSAMPEKQQERMMQLLHTPLPQLGERSA